MILTLDTIARQRSSLTIAVRITDQNGQDVSPTSLAWDLMDMSGNPINNRVAVSIPSVPASITISGDDLDIFTGESAPVRRSFRVTGTYGTGGLPILDECRILIHELTGVARATRVAGHGAPQEEP